MNNLCLQYCFLTHWAFIESLGSQRLYRQPQTTHRESNVLIRASLFSALNIPSIYVRYLLRHSVCHLGVHLPLCAGSSSGSGLVMFGIDCFGILIIDLPPGDWSQGNK